MRIRRLIADLLLAFLLVPLLSIPALAEEAEPTDEPLEAVADESDPLEVNSGGTVNVYRLYNRKTSEHLYTTSKKEYDTLPYRTHGDWMCEGVAWIAPKKSSTPVFRLYNKGLGDHHYTTSKGERDALTRKGWRYEGVAFYSDDSKRVPLYRLYNGRLKAGQHHYTTSKGERDSLVRKSGWRNEGVGWYGISGGSSVEYSQYRELSTYGIPASSLSRDDQRHLAYLLSRLDRLGLVNFYGENGQYYDITNNEWDVIAIRTVTDMPTHIVHDPYCYVLDKRTHQIRRYFILYDPYEDYVVVDG